jgi:hypothetical protein
MPARLLFNPEQRTLLIQSFNQYSHLRTNGRRGRRNYALERLLSDLVQQMITQFGDEVIPNQSTEERRKLRAVSYL